MHEILETLDRRNLCYESFLKLCEEFSFHFSNQTTMGEIDEFHAKRKVLFQNIEKLDTSINSKIQNPQIKEWLENNERAKILIQKKDALIQSILSLDQHIFKFLEKLREETVQKILALQLHRKNLSQYKSPLEQIEKAEKIRTIDNKA